MQLILLNKGVIAQDTTTRLINTMYGGKGQVDERERETWVNVATVPHFTWNNVFNSISSSQGQ